tara:strand:+ start:36877 stop:37410 length:534 start_codon:yes stop_codon:yes gene_type:complete
MKARAVCCLALAALLLPATSATAEAEPSHTDRERRFTLSYQDSLRPAKPPEGSEAIVYLQNGPLRASVSTFESANRSAYRRDQSKAFFDSIETGIAASTTSYKRQIRKHQRIDRAPTLDLSFRRTSASGAREIVWMRFLFRYRFTVVATAIVPASAKRSLMREAKNFAESLVPLEKP